MRWHTYANYVHILMSCYRCCHVSDILVSSKWAIRFIWLMHVCARTTHISYWINHRFTTAFCLERCVFFYFLFFIFMNVKMCFDAFLKQGKKRKKTFPYTLMNINHIDHAWNWKQVLIRYVFLYWCIPDSYMFFCFLIVVPN